MELLAGTSGYSYKEWLGPFYPDKLPPTKCFAITPNVSRPSRSTTRSTECRPRPCSRNGRTKCPIISPLPEGAESASLTICACGRPNRTWPSSCGAPAPSGASLVCCCSSCRPTSRRIFRDCGSFSRCCRPPPAPRSSFATPHGRTTRSTRRCAAGRALCVTDTDEGDTPFVATSDWGYLRLRRTHYDDQELRAWAERIAQAALPQTYVYFMHEDEALGTRFAQRLNELWVEGAQTDGALTLTLRHATSCSATATTTPRA